MAEHDILGKALARGKAKGEALDKDYLLAEMQKIAYELGTVLSGYTAADQGILLFLLRVVEKKHGSGDSASGAWYCRRIGENLRRHDGLCREGGGGMKKESIIAAAINRGFESGKLMDTEYLLAESQKLADRFAEIVNDTAKEDWPLVILTLERVAQGLRSHIPESGGRCVDSLAAIIGSVSYMQRRENDG